MRAHELIIQLQNLPPDTEVILSSKALDANYSPLDYTGEMHYVPMTKSFGRVDFEPDNQSVPCVVLVPKL